MQEVWMIMSVSGSWQCSIRKIDISGNFNDDTTAKKFGKSLQARFCFPYVI